MGECVTARGVHMVTFILRVALPSGDGEHHLGGGKQVVYWCDYLSICHFSFELIFVSSCWQAQTHTRARAFKFTELSSYPLTHSCLSLTRLSTYSHKHRLAHTTTYSLTHQLTHFTKRQQRRDTQPPIPYPPPPRRRARYPSNHTHTHTHTHTRRQTDRQTDTHAL